jgi:hypothetical protein
MRPEFPVKAAYDAITLLTVTTAGAVASTNSTAKYLQRPPNGFIFTLDVSAAATEVGDTLDVKIQTTLDGTNFYDVCYFTQVLGNGGAKRYVGKITASATQAMYETGTALTAGNIRAIFGDTWRVNYVTVDANANSAFTFTVTAIPM